MNKFEMPSREEAAEKNFGSGLVSRNGLEPLQPRRGPPQTATLLLPVWGYSYVRQFLEWGLPTLLAPGNVPSVARSLPTQFIILTSADDERFIREHAAFKRLAATCTTEIHLIDHLITDGNYSTTITLAYAEEVRRTGEAMLDTCFFFLVSDYLVADGSFANALKHMQSGASAVVVGNFQIAREDALGWLQNKLRLAKHSLAVQPRELMQWALNHLHPATLANMVNIPFSHNSHANRLFWRVNGNTILGRFYLMHMLCVRPEVTNFTIGSSCDYSFIPEMCPSRNVDAIIDSDEYLVIEMQPRDHEWTFLRPGPLKPRALAKHLLEWTTDIHRDNARHSIIFHAGELPPQIGRAVAEADDFIAEVSRNLNRSPRPYRDHPYWRGAMAAFNEAIGHRLEREDWPFVLGMPGSPDRLTQWIFWRAKFALLGRPPYVFPWHPFWPDFRKVLQELEPFFTDVSTRLLMVSNQPTAFTVALADTGERANRLRSKPFLQNPPERYEPMHGKFDLCLLELSESEMQDGDELIDRIVPLMKQGGRIVVFVANRRPLNTAGGFSNGVTYNAARFIRSGAQPIAIHFVPASRLRWLVFRGLAKLRSITNRGPWLGVPAVVLGAPPLILLAFIGNIDVLRRARQIAPHGITSSLVMRLLVDAPRITGADSYPSLKRERRNNARGDVQLDVPALPLAIGERTREPQYNRCVELKNEIGLTTLGLMTNQVWYDDPRRLMFLLARYKFVAKMLSGRRNAGEVGCGDAFGTRVVLQEVPDITVYDFDPIFIEDVRARYDERWPIKAEVHDIIAGPLPREHEALFSLDVIEHIATEHEDAFLANLRSSLTPNGVLIIGTPSAELQAYASPLSKAGHINCKSGQQLKALLEYYFAEVFMFSMNDEVVHTGFYPMAHYLFAICTRSL